MVNNTWCVWIIITRLIEYQSKLKILQFWYYTTLTSLRLQCTIVKIDSSIDCDSLKLIGMDYLLISPVLYSIMHLIITNCRMYQSEIWQWSGNTMRLVILECMDDTTLINSDGGFVIWMIKINWANQFYLIKIKIFQKFY